MTGEFWRERWREGRIGFHEGKPNEFLARHGDRLARARRVLVPLCGKTVDLGHLAQRGFEVVGVELVEDAAAAFFREHALEPEIARGSPFTTYRAGSVTIHVGDFFATTAAVVGSIDAVYDRAALIALPPEVRPRYVAHLRSLVAPGSPGILVTIEYPQHEMAGPPFAVLEAEVHALFAELRIERIDEAPPKLRDNGVSFVESCYAVTF